MTVNYKVTITETGKPMGRPKKEAGYQDGNYHIFNEETEHFRTLKEARAFIAERYGKCKRDKTYNDKPNGEAIHTGFVYCFKNEDISHSPVDKWYQQDWVNIYKMKSEPII